MSTARDSEIIDAVLVAGSSRIRRPGMSYIFGLVALLAIGFVAGAVLVFRLPPWTVSHFVGGTRLVYAIADPAQLGSEDTGTTSVVEKSKMDELVSAVRRRMEPNFADEAIIRPVGEEQIEIIIPSTDLLAVDFIKKAVTTAGILQFRIMANTRDHQDVIDLAIKATQDPDTKRRRSVVDENGQRVGLWVRVDRESADADETGIFRVDVTDLTVRDEATGEILTIPPDVSNDPTVDNDRNRRAGLTRFIADQKIQEIEVLMSTNDGLDVGGKHLERARPAVDENSNPAIHFTMTNQGGELFGELTAQYSPDGGFTRQLGIVLDDKLLSAPIIQGQVTDHGRITGQFTREDVEFLAKILEAGTLPAVLEPVTEELVDQEPTAAGNIRKILVAGFGLLLCTWIALSVRYRWSGVAASMACLVHCIVSSALLLLSAARFSASLLSVFIVWVFIVTVCHAVICEADRRERATVLSEPGRRRSPFLFAIGSCAVLFVIAVVVGVVAQALGGFGTRNLAIASVCSCISGLITLLALWLPPVIATTTDPHLPAVDA
jgi:SecD/SecF fusion protein